MGAPFRIAVAALLAASAVTQDSESCLATGSCEESEEASALQVKSGKPDLAMPDTSETYEVARQLHSSKGWLSCGNSAAHAKKDDYTNCTMTGGTGCELAGLSGRTRVFPGGSTVCLDTPDYWFEVIPGDLRKLYLHFQGGGACWNKLSYTIAGGQCSTIPYTVGTEGLFDNRANNPYASWTRIVVQYCSGDMHGGDTEQPWGPNGEERQQRGVKNARSVVDYALANFPEIDDLTVGGCSAGSLGLQLWANRVFNDFKDRGARMAAIGDSFLGVLYPPPYIQKSQVWLYKTWNMCNTGVLDPKEQKMCNAGTLKLVDVWEKAMADFPDADFAQINSKADETQIKFEKLFELTALANLQGFLMTDEQYYQAANVFLKPLTKYPNYHVYLVDGTQHCFTPNNYIYEASPMAFNETTNIGPSMITWVNRVQDPGETDVDNICYGEEKYVKSWPFPAIKTLSYCDKALKPHYRNLSSTP